VPVRPDRLVVPVQPGGSYPDIEPVKKHSDVQRGIEPICHCLLGFALSCFSIFTPAAALLSMAAFWGNKEGTRELEVVGAFVDSSALCECGSGAARRRALRGPCLCSKPPGEKKKRSW
jgi:hypothetical protein